MIVKALAALSLALVSVPAIPQSVWEHPAATETGIDPSVHPEVVAVRCIPGTGSAFSVGPHILISVAHVTGLGGCAIQGKPITVLQTSGDFTILSSAAPAGKWLTVDCGGFVRGKKYIAIGFARGLPVQTTVDIEDMGYVVDGFERLWGVFTVIPGQSGGPIIDPETGKVVGTVNVYNPQKGDSGSIPLRDTPVCKGDA
jgi:hypothetical protein